MMRQIAIFTISLFLALSLNACGFHLRGSAPLPSQLRVLYLQSSDPYSAFTKQVQQVLTSIGTRLVEEPDENNITLAILSDNFSQQTTSANTANQLTIFTLTESIAYQLNDTHGRVLFGPTTLTVTRTYSVNSNQVLSSTNEQPMLRQEMQRDLIVQLLNQLSSKRARQALQML